MFVVWKEKMIKNNDSGPMQTMYTTPNPSRRGGAKPKDRVKKGRLSLEKGSHVLFPSVVESFKYNKVIPAVRWEKRAKGCRNEQRKEGNFRVKHEEK